MNYAIVLAGGKGSRFWPLSTGDEPKQFLSLYSRKSLIEETVARTNKLIEGRNIYIAANRTHKNKILSVLRDFKIPKDNILLEPQGRNTLLPIAVLAKKIYFQDKDAVVVVLPSDHFIRDGLKFKKSIEKAVKKAKEGYIVILGIRPDYPETGYGYVKVAPKGGRVVRFIEKPQVKAAERLIKEKDIFWNAGIFIFKAATFLEELKKFKPDFYKLLFRIKNTQGLMASWNKFPSLSIDYGIMEKTKRAALIASDFSWIDLGCWRAIEGVMKRDKSGNISYGRHIDLGSKNITVWSASKTVATIGLKNLIIVDTKAGLLVCAKDKAQDVKKLNKLIK